MSQKKSPKSHQNRQIDKKSPKWQKTPKPPKRHVSSEAR